ncbi:MAG: MinD/ParA family protein [Candidatus Eisenbacteria bacterium]
MRSQADKLRALRVIRSETPDSGALQPDRPRARVRTIAVTSGKGGVGKSMFATNLAILCARAGKKVLLVDADLSLANIDLLLGMIPKHNLGDVVSGSMAIEDVVVETPYGVRLLPASSGLERLADLDDFSREKLLRELSKFEESVDLIILDTATGIGRQTIHFAGAADEIAIVTTPEPTAFSDAYATLKVLAQRSRCGQPFLVVNRTGSAEEARRTAKWIQTVSHRFLGFEPELLGHIPEDATVGTSVLRQEPLVSLFPQSSAAQALLGLTDRILTEPGPYEPIGLEPEGVFRRMAS